MTTTAHTTTAHLVTCIRHWPDLVDALGAPTTTPTWPPTGRLTDYLTALDEQETERQQALALRTLERDPDQIGQRPIPIRLTVHETMRIVQAALVHCADAIAGSVQRPAMGRLPDGYPDADRARRAQLVAQDRQDPRRWTWTGTRPGAVKAALWLLGRVQGSPGPFRPLSPLHLDHIAAVARGAAERVESALDVGERTADVARPCPHCSGRLQMRGGAGAPPIAHCTRCGHTWTQQDIAAVA